MGIGEVLEKGFGIKKAFLKAPKVKSMVNGVEFQYLTDAGEEAYGKLVDILGELDCLTNGCYNLSRLIEELDEIVDGTC